MILSYTDILGTGKRCRVKATVTTEHSASSYGQPVVLLEDGAPLNAESWVLLNYEVVKATKAEADLMQRWLRNIYTMIGADVMASIGRKGGQAKTPAKAAAAKARANVGLAAGRKALAALTPEQRSENARKAAKARWGKKD